VNPQSPPIDVPVSVPLCVDLDESLVRTDVMIESLLSLVRKAPGRFFRACFWLMRGRAYFKCRIAERCTVDAPSLPYNEDVLAFLREEHARGRPIILATAAHQDVADAVAAHLGLFTAALGSSPEINLTGSYKARELVRRYGEKGFLYVGDRGVDLKVWRHAAGAVMVQPSATLVKAAENLTQVVRVFPRRRNRVVSLLKAMRPYQWVKNFLLFAPLFLAHKFSDPNLVVISLIAFAAFSLCASSVYIINDLMDLDSDRHHPTKRRRPMAAGDVPILWAAGLAPILILVSFAIASLLNAPFVATLAAYFILTLAYSLRVKQIPAADVLFLAGLYTLRIYAGSRATDIYLSQWLSTFSIFFFLCLALVKRTSELVLMQRANKSGAKGRGYMTVDLPQVSSLASASGYLSVLVLALYTSSPDVASLYRNPQMLWMLCPLFLFWISRILILANRGEVHSDPIVHALRDRVSYVFGVLVLLVIFVAQPF
jgi:4-hydroxybenzoate polyprenyltransferase